MEKHKEGEPHFSSSLKELASFLVEKRGHAAKSQMMSCAKSEASRYSMHDFSAINPVDSIWNTKCLLNDSILTNKGAID